MEEIVELRKSEYEQLMLEITRMRNALKVLGIDPASVVKDQKYDVTVYINEIN